MSRQASLQQTALQYLDSTVTDQEQDAEEKRAWRRSCYTKGIKLTEHLQTHWGPLTGKKILDVACAWGGHALAIAEAGAEVVAADLNDHALENLASFSRSKGLKSNTLRSDCQRLPFQNEMFSGIVALELVEHIPSVETFAREAARVLKPGGFLLLSTPPRWRSFIWGEPHYQVKGLTLLPFSLQGIAARRIFKRQYPYPIERQYTTATEVARPFEPLGFKRIILMEGRFGELANSIPALGPAIEERFFSYLLLKKADFVEPT